MFNFAKNIKDRLTGGSKEPAKPSIQPSSQKNTGLTSVFNNAKQIATVLGTKLLDKASEIVNNQVYIYSLEVTSENLLTLSTAIDDRVPGFCRVTYDVQFGANMIDKNSVLLSLNDINLHGLSLLPISTLFKYLSSCVSDRCFTLQFASPNYTKENIQPKSYFPSVSGLVLFSASHCTTQFDSFLMNIQPQLLETFYSISKNNTNNCYENLLNGESECDCSILHQVLYKLMTELSIYLNKQMIEDYSNLFVRESAGTEESFRQMLRILHAVPPFVSSSIFLILFYLKYLMIYMPSDKFNAIICIVALKLLPYSFPPLLQQLSLYADILLSPDYCSIWYVRSIFEYLFDHSLNNTSISSSTLQEPTMKDLIKTMNDIHTRTELMSFLSVLPECDVYSLAIYLLSQLSAPLLPTSFFVLLKLSFAIHDPINRIHSIQTTMDMLPDMSRWALAYICRFAHYSKTSRSALYSRLIPVMTHPDSKLPPVLYTQHINLYTSLFSRLVDDCEIYFVPSKEYLAFVSKNQYLYPSQEEVDEIHLEVKEPVVEVKEAVVEVKEEAIEPVMEVKEEMKEEVNEAVVGVKEEPTEPTVEVKEEASEDVKEEPTKPTVEVKEQTTEPSTTTPNESSPKPPPSLPPLPPKPLPPRPLSKPLPPLPPRPLSKSLPPLPPPVPKRPIQPSSPSLSTTATHHSKDVTIQQSYNPAMIFLYPSFYQFNDKRYMPFSYEEKDIPKNSSLYRHLHSDHQPILSPYPHDCMICTVDYHLSFQEIHQHVLDPIPKDHFNQCPRCNPWLLVPSAEYKPKNIHVYSLSPLSPTH